MKAEALRKWRDASEETEELYIDGLKDGEKINNYPDFRNYLLSKLLGDYNYSREPRKGSGTQ